MGHGTAESVDESLDVLCASSSSEWIVSLKIENFRIFLACFLSN